jgi:hypothetical protein
MKFRLDKRKKKKIKFGLKEEDEREEGKKRGNSVRALTAAFQQFFLSLRIQTAFYFPI